MRVIKFRAWDVKHSLYESVPNLYWFEENGVAEQNEDGTFDGHYTNWILEQFTGLKDSDGVDIYEGDIIDFGLIAGIVAFDGVGYHLKSFRDDRAGYILKTKDYGESTVMGNIHQHRDHFQ